MRQKVAGPATQLLRRPQILIPLLLAVLAVELLAAAWSPLRIDAAARDAQPLLGHAVFPGAIVGDTRYGVTFTGMAQGKVTGWWTVTVNYTPSSADGGVVNEIVGGKWQVTLIERGLYQGTIYGDVVGGRIDRDPTGLYADVDVQFLVSGGTGTYAGATGTGRLLDGKADHRPLPPTLNGIIDLDLDRR